MSSTLVPHCRICRMVTAPQEAPLYDQIVFETDNYFAVASLGGFIPGWVLVCSKAHDLSLAKHYARSEFVHCITSVVASVESLFGKPIIFEHGPRAENSATACGTTHAHLHVVPFQGPLPSLLAEADRELEWRQVCTNAMSGYDDREYLYFASKYAGTNTVGYAAELKSPRSQFFRHVIARAIGRGELANYRAAPLEASAIDTGKRLRMQFESTASAAA